MKRYVCIHGHFYQPPRENPWLETIEMQDTAYPYHDWNERITAECYAPNAASRILDKEKNIINIVNNYSNISFNFGATLLSWMQKYAKDVYQHILEADKKSQKKFSGHGSALAQVYNHMIMPLSNTRDKRTQVLWGIKDFEYRFKRKPEGIWLAETAVDTETLEILSEYGIHFTILAPHQVGKVKKIDDSKWKSVKGEKIDTQLAYLCRLPSGRTINLFFYDGPVSQELAFHDLLKSGEKFAERLIGLFPKQNDQIRLVHIATDGETYGHHQNFGDMALGYCLHYIESNKLAKVTNYGEFLEKCPPEFEVEIVEKSSWSCIHGIDRWWSDCGCSSGMNPGWNQAWREPLRNALDWLRESVNPLYEHSMGEFSNDPWEVRNHYIEVILERNRKNIERFLKQNMTRDLQHEEHIRALKLLELQRHALLMYTSCGWFFDEISGIETTQVIQYAARVIQLANELFHQDFESEFKKRLELAPSNVPEFKNGAVIYESLVKPATVDLLRVGAHFAIASLFDEQVEEKNVYCYKVSNEVYDRKDAGKQKIVIGRSRIQSTITWEEEMISFAVLHLGDHNMNGGVRIDMGDQVFQEMHQDIKKVFTKSNIPEVIQLMNQHFGKNNYSLKHLFKDEQKRIFDEIISSAMEDIESHFRQIYEQYFPLMQAKDELQVVLPKALSTSIEFIINRDLIDFLNNEKVNMKKLERIVDEVKRWSFELDQKILSYVASKKINILMQRLSHNPQNLNTLKSVESLLRIISPLGLNLNLWKAQNNYFAISKGVSKGHQKIKSTHSLPQQWNQYFQNLGEYLKIKSG